MADNKFPNTPKYNQLIEKDEQIVKVPLDTMDWAARKAGMPSSVKNSNTIRHVN